MCSTVHQILSNTKQWFNLWGNCSSIKHIFMKLGDGFPRKRGKNKHTCPIFDNDILASSNQMKLWTTDYMFPIKQDEMCHYDPLCFMSSGIILDDIIMNIFTQSTNKSTTAHQNHFFSRFKDDAIQSCKGSMQDFTWKKCWYKKDTAFSSLHWSSKIEKISFWYLIYRRY